MNITNIKFIALILMLLDHVGAVFGLTGWNIISSELSEFFRLIGRVSFPLFAFSVANGWEYTKNKESYFYRIVTCACFSQIPYTLAFYPVNTMYINQNEKSLFINIGVSTILLYTIVTFLCISFYYYYISDNKKILVSISISILFSIFILKLKFVWFNFNELNIFYTFVIGLLYIYCFEYIKKYRNQPKIKNIFMFIIVLIIISIFIGLNSDYGVFLLGPILIFLLYITRKYRWLQSVLIVSWAIILYGVIYGNFKNAIFVIPAAIIILFYNKKIIPNKRYSKVFYIFYPIHLLLIGLINIFIKFIII